MSSQGLFEPPAYTYSEGYIINIPSTIAFESMTEVRQDYPDRLADANQSLNLTSNKVEYIVDTFVRTEVTPKVVLVFGGEPTVCPGIDLILWAVWRDLRRIIINTKSRRSTYDDGVLAEPTTTRPANPNLIKHIEEQTGRIFQKSEIVPPPRALNVVDFPDYKSDRVVLNFRKGIKTSLEGLTSAT